MSIKFLFVFLLFSFGNAETDNRSIIINAICRGTNNPNFCAKFCCRGAFFKSFSFCCAHLCAMTSENICKSSYEMINEQLFCSKKEPQVCFSPDQGTTFGILPGRCRLCELIMMYPSLPIKEVSFNRCRNSTVTDISNI